MKKLYKFVFIAFTVLMLAGTANAATIIGDIFMTGRGSGIEIPATAIPTPDSTEVDIVTGDFIGYLAADDPVDFYGFIFDPAGSPVANPLWEAGGFTFVLESVAVEWEQVVSEEPLHTVFALSGAGTITGNGFDPTFATWSMTVDSISGNFTFSSATTAVPVPVPVLLFASGLVSLFGIRRKFRTKGA